jgi:hypothetical protein
MNTNNYVPSHLEERIDLLTKELASKRRATNWGTNLTLLVGLLALVLLCGYFGFGYYMFDNNTQPETIVSAAKMYLQDYSEQGRQIASEEVRKSAPVWAREVSRELIANMPSMREKAETTIVGYFDEQLERSEKLTTEQFSKIMEENRDEFEEAIGIIMEEGSSDEFVTKIMPIIEKRYAPEMKANVSNVLGGLQDINRRLRKLAKSKTLNPIEEQQKHILGLTRLLREE